MKINMIADTSVSSAPTGFSSTIQAAATYFASVFSDNITINITYGWGSYDNSVDTNLTGSTGAEGGSIAGTYTSYSQVVSWLTASAKSATDKNALANLPTSNTNSFYVTSAQEKAFGAVSGTNTAVDGSIGFGTSSSSSFWYEAALHEIAHALGRSTDYYAGDPTIMDLYRYGSAGNFQWTGGQSAYLSYDGGVTKVADFSNTSDYGDFAVDSLTPADPFDYLATGAVKTLTATDIGLMDAIGFTVATPPKSVSSDFNGDGTSDILWRNVGTGSIVVSLMNGSQVIGSAGLGGDLNWSVAGTGDFNGDGKADILWRNSSTGYVVESFMNGTQVTSSAAIGGDTTWTIAGTGDFNGDGKSDILWRNSTGVVYETQMNGSQVIGSASLGGDQNWSVVGTGDFNGDGKSDILWRSSNGQVVVSLMNGSQVIGSAGLGGDMNWSVAGTGDFNGDGKTDILWRNGSTGYVVESLMNGTQVISSTVLGGDLNWSVAGTGDFNGDGHSDILWRYSTGAVYETLMNGSQVIGSAGLGGDLNWSNVKI